LRDQARDRAELLHHGFRAGHVAIRAKRGCIDRIERPVAHGLEDQVAVADRRRSNDEDNAGRLLHDLAGRLSAVDARHDQVHEDDVRTFGLGHADGLFAGVSGPDELELRRRGQDAAKHLSGGTGVVDDGYFHRMDNTRTH
jgi:hypothetical protein